MSQVFGVDHFKPKSVAPELQTHYGNLYYCCNLCNTYKGSYWPDAPTKMMLLNPCDDVLAKHIRFDSKSGEMTAITKQGAFFLEQFRLNAEDVPQHRLSVVRVIRYANESLAKADVGLQKITQKLAVNPDPVTRDRLAAQRGALMAMKADAIDTIHRHSGTLPLKPLSARHVEPDGK